MARLCPILSWSQSSLVRGWYSVRLFVRITWSSCEHQASFSMSGATPLSFSTIMTRILKKYSSDLNDYHLSLPCRVEWDPSQLFRKKSSLIYSVNRVFCLGSMTGHCSLCWGSENKQRKTTLYSNQGTWANKETNEETKCSQLLISALKKVTRVWQRIMEGLLFTMRTSVTESLVELLWTGWVCNSDFLHHSLCLISLNHFLELFKFASLMVYMHAHIFL